jgi:hypothetical protein
VGAGFLALLLVALTWLAVDRRPPAWDYANHLERALRCVRDLSAGDVAAVLDRSAFYPPLVPCSAGIVQRLTGSDVVGGQIVVLAFLGLGMFATAALGRRLAGPAGGALAALLFGGAPFVVFLTFRFQLDLPLAAMVAVMLETLLRTEAFQRRGWAVAAGAVAALGMLTKPPFAAYVLPAALPFAVRVRDRRAAANAATAALVALGIALPWYGPRMFGLQSQLTTRGFTQAAAEGDPEVLTWAALAWYPAHAPAVAGVAAVALFCLGLVVAGRRGHWWWVWTALAPLAILALVRNKDFRYLLPVLPLVAAIAALGWSALPARGRIATAVAAAAITALQISSTATNAPPDRVTGLGLRYALASPPMRADWRQHEILALILRDSAGAPATVSVVPNHELFSVSNFRYYAVRDGARLRFTRAWDEQPVGVDYVVVKSGDVGPPWTERRIRRIERQLAEDPHLGRVFPVIGEFPLPDGSAAQVRARRLGEGPPVAPAAIAQAIQEALRVNMADVAREVDGFDARLLWDDGIRRGRVARADLRVAAATVGELRRPGTAELRLRDLHLVLEDVLINPYSVLAERRLDLLDVGAIRVDRLTVTAGDLQRFLGGLRKFRPSVALDHGALAVRVEQFGPDVTGHVAITPAADRPFAVVARDVRWAGVPVPAALVNWIVRTFDPSARLARRLPAPVAIGPVAITPDAVRIVER